MFKTWNLLDSGINERRGGHHYWETKALVDELVARGTDVRVFGLESITPDLFPGARVHPHFSTFYYARPSIDPAWGEIENFILLNRTYQSELARADASLFRDSLTFFPTLSDRQLLGTLRWLASFDDATRPKTAITLEAMWNWSPTGFTGGACRKLWAECPPAVKKDVALTVREPGSAILYERLLGTRPHVLPSPLGVPARRAQIMAGRPAPPGPPVVSFVAGARRDKGAMLLTEAIKLCAPLDVRFFVQVKGGGDPGFDLNSLSVLEGLDKVELYRGVLERDAYYDRMAGSVVLLPYVPEFYQVRWSGVYAEAKFLGAPVIVAAGSWIAEDVKRLGNGVVFENFSPQALAAAVEKASREIDTLRARAAAVAREYSAVNGADRCADAVAGLFAR
jgi:glycosyltransferase involved in cell wall biosynthesis